MSSATWLRDRVAPRFTLGDLRQLVVDGRELGVEAVQVRAHLLQRELGEWVVETLAIEPFTVLAGAGLLALAVDVAVAQERLDDSVTGGGPRAAQVIATADEVAQALLLGRWRGDEAKLPGPVEAHQLLGVAAIGLDSITSPDRGQRRSDHVTGNPMPLSSR